MNTILFSPGNDDQLPRGVPIEVLVKRVPKLPPMPGRMAPLPPNAPTANEEREPITFGELMLGCVALVFFGFLALLALGAVCSLALWMFRLVF